MSEYETVIKAVDTIMSFLNTHESNSTTCLWESDIDGAILKTDWGYFEEGLDEIRDYCDRLERAEQTEPMIYPQVDGITPSVIQTEPQKADVYTWDGKVGEIELHDSSDCPWK